MLKIKDNRNNRTFVDLEIGAVFNFNDSFYMKICEIVNDDGIWFNAVNLATGWLNTIDDSDEVNICCNAELIIND